MLSLYYFIFAHDKSLQLALPTKKLNHVHVNHRYISPQLKNLLRHVKATSVIHLSKTMISQALRSDNKSLKRSPKITLHIQPLLNLFLQAMSWKINISLRAISEQMILKEHNLNAANSRLQESQTQIILVTDCPTSHLSTVNPPGNLWETLLI